MLPSTKPVARACARFTRPRCTNSRTRYHPTSFADAFFSTLHEVGHGLYEQGLDSAHAGTPMGDAASLAVHESQARLWENAVGRSRGFWTSFFPMARQMFPAALSDATTQQQLLILAAEYIMRAAALASEERGHGARK